MTESLFRILSPQDMLTQEFLDFLADHGDAQHIYIHDILRILNEMHLLKKNVLQKLQTSSDFLEIFRALCNLKHYSDYLANEAVCLDILQAYEPELVGSLITYLGEKKLLSPERYQLLKTEDYPRQAAQGIYLLNHANLLTVASEQALLQEFTSSKNDLIRTLSRSKLSEVPYIKSHISKILAKIGSYSLNKILTLIIPLEFFTFKNIPIIFNKLIQHSHLDVLRLALENMQIYPKLMNASNGLDNFLLLANLKRYHSFELSMSQLSGTELLTSQQANQYFQDILKHPKPEDAAQAMVLIKESELLHNENIYQNVMTHANPYHLARCINTLFRIFPNYQDWLNLFRGSRLRFF
jgi:hypothetical protein